jgi:CrcB protein
VSAGVLVAALAAGAGGALLRYLVSVLAARRAAARGDATPFPWAVLVVNVVGSAIGGAVLGLAQVGGVSADARLILLSGLCGGLTTFSTFGVETVQLVIDGRARAALVSVSANLVLGLAAATGGWLLARALA